MSVHLEHVLEATPALLLGHRLGLARHLAATVAASLGELGEHRRDAHAAGPAERRVVLHDPLTHSSKKQE